MAARAAVVEHSSFANFQEVKIEASEYDFTVDLDQKIIEGYVALTIKAQAATQRLVLDTRGLDIVAVEALSAGDVSAEAGPPLEHSFAEAHPALGSALTVQLGEPLAEGAKAHVGIHFRVNETATALQFLTPAQTAGGVHPYLFTQCQAIHARSFVPCQDTPNVKMTYTARVTVAAPLTALMSAKTVEGAATLPPSRFAALLGDRPARTFAFEQSLPIPSYLLALAVGELESRPLGPISRVWSEPSVVESARYEFEETAKFIDAGEAIAGPYQWGQYDLLLLPPSFPYGGMENPCLTFVTPTLLTGDRSATNVVAHEIAHSWTGNLVTNASWEHFWLNEGFTVFLERKILGRLSGPAAEQFAAANGLQVLQDTVTSLGATHPFTALVPDLSGGADPDDAFSSVPYEKGFYFLYYLQTLVGGPSAFEPFLRAYLDKFKFSTVSTDEFRAFFGEHFADCAAIADIDWQTWLFAPGMPPAVNEYDGSLGAAAAALALRWHCADIMRLGTDGPEGASPADVAGWSADQLGAFLAQLNAYSVSSRLHRNTTRRLHNAYGLDGVKNPDVRCAWLKLCIDAGDDSVLDAAADFLRSQGRMKFLRPLYKALYGSKIGRQRALDLFGEARQGYHPIAEKMVAGDLGL